MVRLFARTGKQETLVIHCPMIPMWMRLAPDGFNHIAQDITSPLSGKSDTDESSAESQCR